VCVCVCVCVKLWWAGGMEHTGKTLVEKIQKT
jgi:hypothetical protein